MSGDMFNNPDAIALPDTHDSQTLDNKIPDSTDDERVLACWGRVNQRMRKDIGDAHGATGSSRFGLAASKMAL